MSLRVDLVSVLASLKVSLERMLASVEQKTSLVSFSLFKSNLFHFESVRSEARYGLPRV